MARGTWYIPFSIQEMSEFQVILKFKNYPAVHHSSLFKQSYHPTYRVVYLSYLSQNLDLAFLAAQSVWHC